MFRAIDRRRWDFEKAAHLLNRAGFGGPPSVIEELVELGPEAAVTRLVDPPDSEESVTPPGWAKPDPERWARYQRLRTASAEERRAMRQEEQQEQRARIRELRLWWLNRMATTQRSFDEKLVLFWHGHFATSVQKVKDAWLMYRQLETFRLEGAGNWQTLLISVTRDPAMLIWLDQAQSRKERPNENYARELMELFTLGEGHYTEADVREAARALTGLTLDRVAQEPSWRPRLHDAGTKTYLGATGDLGPESVIARIVAQPQAARFITAKLWSFFASENPSPRLVDGLADEFRRGGGHFRPFLRTVFLSEEFYAPDVIRTQIKSPVQWLICSVRQLERPLPQTEMMTAALRELGQDLLAPPNVKGWDGGIAWINTGTLTRRQEIAGRLVLGREALPDLVGGERGERIRQRLDRLGTQPDRRFGPVNVEKLFTAAERSDGARLVAALSRRFLQSNLRESLREDVRTALGEDRTPDSRAILGAIRVIMESTDYQLT